MYWYRVGIDIPEILYKTDNCVGVESEFLFRWGIEKSIRKICVGEAQKIITYCEFKFKNAFLCLGISLDSG